MAGDGAEDSDGCEPLRGAGCLTVVGGGQIGLTHRVGDEPLVIGRGEDVDAFVSGDGTSRHHAELVRAHTGSIKLVDLGSRNGSFVNGVRVGTVVLDDGDKIRIGDTVFDFHYVRRDDRTTVDLAVAVSTMSKFSASDVVSRHFITTMENLAKVHYAGGRFADALAAYERGRVGLQATPGVDPRELAAVLLGIGACQLELRAPALAMEPLQRAVDLQQAAGATARELSDARFLLATAIGVGDPRATSLAQFARDPLDLSVYEDRSLSYKIDVWLRAGSPRNDQLR